MNQMQQMLMQAQKMQRELAKAQNELAEKEVKITKEGRGEGTWKGNKTISSLVIDKDALDPENAEMLQEAIVMARNEGVEKIQKATDEIESKITGRTGFPF